MERLSWHGLSPIFFTLEKWLGVWKTHTWFLGKCSAWELVIIMWIPFPVSPLFPYLFVCLLRSSAHFRSHRRGDIALWLDTATLASHVNDLGSIYSPTSEGVNILCYSLKILTFAEVENLWVPATDRHVPSMH